jgi:two-component system sensor histidine kinase KdpD
MPTERESWAKQFGQYLLFTCVALAMVALYARVVHVNQTTVALSFLILILFTAFRRPLGYSVYLSLLCAFLYNFFFLPPYGSLTIADPQNLVALISFLVASVSVNQISARERRQAASLATQSKEIEKLYAFCQRLLLEDKLQELSKSAPALIAASFQLRAVALYLPEREPASMWDPEHLLAGMENLHDATQATGVSSRSASGIRIVPLMLGMRALGVLAMTEGDYTEGLYDAIGSLAAVAIERASALERNSRSEAARAGELLRTAVLDSITHELRTPLTGINLAATTLASNPGVDEEARQDLLSVITEESARMNTLIDEAVTMAQLSTGEIHLQKMSTPLPLIIEEVVTGLRTSLRGRDLKLECALNMPPIFMDPDLIRRALKHLLENALQYSPQRSAIEVSAMLANQKLHVAVKNAGSGIPEDEQPFVFERFFRGAAAGTHPNGTGMGLAIVKAIVEAHRGKICVRSEAGQGTTLSFWIPAVEIKPAT